MNGNGNERPGFPSPSVKKQWRISNGFFSYIAYPSGFLCWDQFRSSEQNLYSWRKRTRKCIRQLSRTRCRLLFPGIQTQRFSIYAATSHVIVSKESQITGLELFLQAIICIQLRSRSSIQYIALIPDKTFSGYICMDTVSDPLLLCILSQVKESAIFFCFTRRESWLRVDLNVYNNRNRNPFIQSV